MHALHGALGSSVMSAKDFLDAGQHLGWSIWLKLGGTICGKGDHLWCCRWSTGPSMATKTCCRWSGGPILGHGMTVHNSIYLLRWRIMDNHLAIHSAMTSRFEPLCKKLTDIQ